MPRPPASVLGFYSRSAAQAVRAAARSRLGRDRPYRVGRFAVTLPAGHRLPWFQSVFPAYDRYAAELLQELCRGAESPLLIDVGVDLGRRELRMAQHLLEIPDVGAGIVHERGHGMAEDVHAPGLLDARGDDVLVQAFGELRGADALAAVA